MAITFHLYFKINNPRHYVILLVKVIETSETWNREKLQHDGNLNALKQLFLFFFPPFEIVLDRFWIGLSRQRKRWYFTRMAIDTRLFYSRVNL